MVNVFGDSGAATLPKPFEDGPTGDDFSMKDHVGDTVLLFVEGIVEKDTKRYGTKKAAKFSKIVAFAKDGTPTVYEDVLIFAAAVPGQVRSYAGDSITAEVVSYPTDFGNDGYKFGPPTPAGVAIAEKYVKAQG